MTAQAYILSTLKALSLPTDNKDPINAPLEIAILNKVLSKKFRKNKADAAAILTAKQAIHFAIKAQQPLTFSLLFGGNKLWRFDEAPEIDWAELFAMTYYARWMKTIADIYPAGAELILYSQDVSVERLNNVPRVETDRYSSSMRHMLKWLDSYLPGNIHITYRRQAEELTNISDYDSEIDEAKKIVLAENNGKLPKLSAIQKLATELNVKLQPGQADDPQWREKIELEHQAVFRTKSLLRFFQEPGRIPICPTPFPGLIVTGSTKRSIAKFWAGIGALEKSGDAYHELVLTPKQLASAHFDWESINIEGLQEGNFTRIRVLV
ncbi:MAG TPA: hypothetical protein VLH38_03225 [Patescibacteria group bacterium]|nr:hypothetical protein [Patescibacteria group bacterium]